jgi:protein-disulfide isomerase
LKLDTAAFDKCLASGEMAEAVKADFNEGVNLGLQGTPGFFVNGRFFSGAMSIEQFNAVIGEELATSAAKEKHAAQR